MPVVLAPPAHDALVARLRAAGCVFAEEEALLLVDAATTESELVNLVARRIDGVPLEHVVGWAEFCGLRIAVDDGVFVPRRRTEFLVDVAAEFATSGAVVVDLCCGSGAVAVALAAREPGLRLFAVDVDPAAVRCAERNLGDAADVRLGDLFAPLPDAVRGAVDLVVVNAPYVPTDVIATMPPEARDHEARIALDGGADGVDVHRRIASEAPAWLTAGGRLAIETSERQAPITSAAMAAAGLAVAVERSEDLDATVVVGTR